MKTARKHGWRGREPRACFRAVSVLCGKNKFPAGVKKKHLTPKTELCTIAQVMKMEKIVRQGLLYDFYGELLTPHQKEVYEALVIDDMSLGEIAEEHGITRQAVFDLIRRCDRILLGYEEKLGLVKKFSRTRELTEEIRELAESCRQSGDLNDIPRIKELAEEILEIA